RIEPASSVRGFGSRMLVCEVSRRASPRCGLWLDRWCRPGWRVHVVDQRSDADGARRAQRTHVLIVLPDSDGELGRVLNVVEEMLLVVEGLALDDGELPPGVCPDREAVDAV